MGMYNPTNTRCQIMASHDLGAPQAMLCDRQSIYNLLDTLLTQGYNSQAITKLTTEISGTGVKTLKLEYPAGSNHGYRVGHLITIQGANEAIFNNTWRVISVPSQSELSVTITNQTATYPSTATGSLISKVKALDWEIVYSSSTQRSYRSKMENSSKNVLTLRYPRHKVLQNANSKVVHEVEVSKNIKLSDGTSIDSYTSHMDYINIAANDNKPFGAFYFHQYSHGANITGTATVNTVRLPWYLIGDGRIFYFIHGYGNINVTSEDDHYLNYNRLDQRYSYRYCLTFGDPNCFDESDVYSGCGTIFSCANHTSLLTGWTPGTSDPTFGGSNSNVPCYFLKTYDGTNPLQTFYMQTIGGQDGSNFNSGYSAQTYPNPITGGYIYYPYYATTSTGNGLNMSRAEIPYARYCPLNCSIAFNNIQMSAFDWKPRISIDGTVTLNAAQINTSYNSPGSWAFNLGV